MSRTDALGHTHQIASDARIVSLVPSITELLCTLGLAPQLVGRTGFCIHPADVVATIPKVGGTKDVNIEKIRKLAPTHLIVNIDENEKPTVDLLAEFIPHIVVTHPNTPRDNLELARLMGAIFQADAAAEAWCAQFEQAYAALRASQAARGAKGRPEGEQGAALEPAPISPICWPRLIGSCRCSIARHVIRYSPGRTSWSHRSIWCCCRASLTVSRRSTSMHWKSRSASQCSWSMAK